MQLHYMLPKATSQALFVLRASIFAFMLPTATAKGKLFLWGVY